MTVAQIGMLTIIALIGCCMLGTAFVIVLRAQNSGTNVLVSPPSATENSPASSQSTTAPTSSTQVILDVPSLFGRSVSEMRSLYRIAPYEDLHPLLGYEDILPSETLSEGYSDGKYSFHIFYDVNQESIGFQVYDGLENHRLRVSDWGKITLMLNLNVTQPPNLINDYRAEWNNHLGYHIEVIRNVSGEYVFSVIVTKTR